MLTKLRATYVVMIYDDFIFHRWATEVPLVDFPTEHTPGCVDGKSKAVSCPNILEFGVSDGLCLVH